MSKNYCPICGYIDCRKLAHVSVQEFPYEGTHIELKAVEGEITDIQTQMAELNRQYKVVQEHRDRIISLIANKQ